MDAEKKTWRALWAAKWYELDPSIKVGTSAVFYFHRVLPGVSTTWQHEPVDLCFYSGVLSDPHSYEQRQVQIARIQHSQWGDVVAVDTRGLDYVFRLSNGQEWIVNAEEQPGTVYDCPDSPCDWQLLVTLTSVSPPLDSIA